MARRKSDKRPGGTVHQVDIDAEMQAAYLDYAMSVIVARALPDVRDGLKPVHRRILYAIHDMGLTHDKPYKKSARIVGEVLGKYHPHGDAAVYEAMARMAQDFSLRALLVDGQGNFGSIDGDAPAAMRYTEARLAALSAEMLRDIGKETVDFGPNFDGSLTEPLVLPALLPNLLVNGASGIAVGMATNIPPHNLGEVCDALIYLIGREGHWDEVNVADLMKFIPGPDFPTGGVVFRYGKSDGEARNDAIETTYAVGRGRFVVQARAHFEEMGRGRARIVVTELPYAVNKARLIERIADLVRGGRLEGIADVRDESDRTGMRLVIELSRNGHQRDVLERLFQLTPMRTVFGASMLALVDGEPRTLPLKRILLYYLEHRQEVVRRRTEYDLARALERAHILEGLLAALSHLDEVIQVIRQSRTADSARSNLMRRFRLTEVQATAILDMPLRRLAQLERRKLEEEHREKRELIKELEELLASPKRILGVVQKELEELKAQYADPRRTKLLDRTEGILTARDLLPDEPVWVYITPNGRIGRQSAKSGGREVAKAVPDRLTRLLVTNTRDDLILITAGGRAGRLPVHQIPQDEGGRWDDLTGIVRDDTVIAAIPISPVKEALEGDCLFLVTRRGRAKRIRLSEVVSALANTPAIIGVEGGDAVVSAVETPGDGDVLLLARQGRGIRFRESEVRTMGLAASGVGAIRLAANDEVVTALLVKEKGHLVTATEKGYIKRTSLSEFPSQGRNGSGVVAAKVSEKTGPLTGADVLSVITKTTLFIPLTFGTSRALGASNVSAAGRNASGSLLGRLAKGAKITGLVALPENGGEEGDRSEERQTKFVLEEKPRLKRVSKTGKAGDSAGKPKAADKERKRTKSTAKTERAAGVTVETRPAAGKAKSKEAASTRSKQSIAPASATGKTRASKGSLPPQPKAKQGRATVLQIGQTEGKAEDDPKVRRGKTKTISLKKETPAETPKRSRRSRKPKT